MKILILKPSSFGDVVQALPVLRLLKQHSPPAQIYWWIDSSLAPLLEGDPDLAGVVRFERKRWAAPLNWPEMARSIRWMRAQNFDLVIDLQCLARSAAFAWLANGRLLVGLDEPREGARGFYDIVVRRHSFHTHAVDWYLSVLPRLGVPVHDSFNWLPERPGVAAEIRRKWTIADAPWILLQPGARWENKRWPADFFRQVLERAASDFPQARFAVLGGPEDRALGQAIASGSPRCLDLTGQLSLPELVEWVRAGTIMVTNDTGPMHVAAALGKPVVALFGPTEPRRTGPYGQQERVLHLNLSCAPCMKPRCTARIANECLRALPVSAVMSALGSRFEEALSRCRPANEFGGTRGSQPAGAPVLSCHPLPA